MTCDEEHQQRRDEDRGCRCKVRKSAAKEPWTDSMNEWMMLWVKEEEEQRKAKERKRKGKGSLRDITISSRTTSFLHISPFFLFFLSFPSTSCDSLSSCSSSPYIHLRPYLELTSGLSGSSCLGGGGGRQNSHFYTHFTPSPPQNTLIIFPQHLVVKVWG
jgi:hypothetical protein